MKGDKRVIAFLDQVLAHELTAIHQHFLHARMFRNWGLKKLDEYEYHESLGEMNFADKLINRILFLEAPPNVGQLGRLYIGENVSEMLKCDLRLGMEALPVLQEAIAQCKTSGDHLARELFEDIMESQEEHRHWIEAQLDLIERIGLHNYQQSQT